MQLLESKKVDFETVNYLNTPLSEAELTELSGKMQLHPRQFIRKRESEFKSLGLKDKLEDGKALIQAMARYPRLIERPIAVKGNRAVLGRPPEKVLDLV